MSSLRIVLVGCSKAKLDHAAPAADLYRGDLFRAARRIAEQADGWFVLSAKYGLLDPAHEVEPYDLTLTSFDRWHHQEWARMVTAQIRAQVPVGSTLVFLAGSAYRDWIEVALRGDYVIESPLAHLGIGRQKQKLAAMARVEVS